MWSDWITILFVGLLVLVLYLLLPLVERHILKKHEGRDFEIGGESPYNKIIESLSMGVVVISCTDEILWVNGVFPLLVGRDITVGSKLNLYLPGFSLKRLIKNQEYATIYHGLKRTFFIKWTIISWQGKENYLITCEDITEQIKTWKKTPEIQPVVAFLHIDNLPEVFRIMTDESKPHLLGAVERILSEWVGSLEGYLKMTGEGRYVVFMTEWGFKQGEKTRFSILDKIREIEAGNEMPLTMSIGFGINDESPSELGRLAKSSLELALERGGDQIVVKSPDKVWFYGGKSTTIEKRTKVKARVTAFALKDLIQQSNQVMVMGHEMADYDSLGASLGIAKAVYDLGKRAWVVLDKHNPNSDKLLTILPEDYPCRLVKVGDALKKTDDNTLLIIVDTHKPSLLADPSLLEKAGSIVIIDHHRRGEEFIEDAKLVYLESYASSTCELVTELLQYLGDQVEISKAEATALLAGITVDTKNFTFQTGVRTFEAASYLRSLGAEPSFIQELLRDDFETAIQKAEVIKNARILSGEIALGKSHQISSQAQVLAAKTADTMLNIAGITGAFVLWPFEGGVAISARSTGAINVQTIMEKMGGGGHFTIAAAQVKDSLDKTEERLIELMQEELEDN